MGTPTRFTAGFTQDAKFQPLGALGIPDPFFFALFYDDFLPYEAGKYTVTATGGSVAQTVANGSGGRIVLTTGAAISDFASIQEVGAGFEYVPTKKLAFLTRVQLADIVNSALIAGLIQTTVTPFTVTDGIYFSKASGGSVIELIVMKGSAVLGSVNISGALTDATDIDLGFYIDRLGNIKGFYGNSLVGYKNQNLATLGPNVALLASALSSTITTAMLTPTLAVEASTAAAQTLVSDFLLAAQER